MQTIDDIKNSFKKQKPSRTVGFSENTKESKVFTPLARSRSSSKKQDLNKLILGLWIRLSEAGEYTLLEQRLKEFGLGQSQPMSDFFRKEGPYLLRCGTLNWSNPEHLRFICEHVPQDLLIEVLRKNNYSNIEGFLLGHTGMEKRGLLLDESMLSERREKLSLLVKTDPEGLEEYIKSKYFEDRFSDGVKKSFREALEKYKATKLKNY